uniref:Uncharacterized protein n=1 Tax=Sus scrofa TaxID=9823 RepID=A0A8D0XMU0_PIG
PLRYVVSGPGSNLNCKLATLIPWLHILRFNQLRIENTQEKKIPESSPKQKLNLPDTSNYLHSIYTVSGIVSNAEMIQRKLLTLCPLSGLLL